MSNKCGFDRAWQSPCENLAPCSEHGDLKCISCDRPATRSCPATGQFVCGAPLCDACEHTIAADGTNGNVGFFRTSPLPDGLGEHCRKTDQVFKSWVEREAKLADHDQKSA